MSNDPIVRRFDLLSNSESGLSYVREKRGGTMRYVVIGPDKQLDAYTPSAAGFQNGPS